VGNWPLFFGIVSPLAETSLIPPLLKKFLLSVSPLFLYGRGEVARMVAAPSYDSFFQLLPSL